MELEPSKSLNKKQRKEVSKLLDKGLVEYVTAKNMIYLEEDHEAGISLDECYDTMEKINKILSKALD